MRILVMASLVVYSRQINPTFATRRFLDVRVTFAFRRPKDSSWNGNIPETTYVSSGERRIDKADSPPQRVTP
jgi:hypothetical protein